MKTIAGKKDFVWMKVDGTLLSAATIINLETGHAARAPDDGYNELLIFDHGNYPGNPLDAWYNGAAEIFSYTVSPDTGADTLPTVVRGAVPVNFTVAGDYRIVSPMFLADLVGIDDGIGLVVTSARYGADNTGATDATAAIQAAIDAVEAIIAGGNEAPRIFIPAGVYQLTAALKVEQDGVQIHGAGKGTLLRQHTAATGVFKNSTGTTYSDCVISNLAITVNTSINGSTAIDLTRLARMTLRDIWIQNNSTDGFDKGITTPSGSISIEHQFYNVNIETEDAAANRGMELDDADGTRIFGGSIEAANGTALQIIDGVGVYVSGVKFPGDSALGVHLDFDAVACEGNTITGCQFSNDDTANNGIQVDASCANNALISNRYASSLTTNITDNGTNTYVVEPQDTLSLPGMFSPAYAGIFVSGGSTPQTLATQNSWEKLTAFTTDAVDVGITADSANDKITVDIAGDYLITVSASFYADVGDYELAVAKEGTPAGRLTCKRSLGASSEGVVSISGNLTVAAADEIDLRARCTTADTKDITIVHAHLSMVRVG